jgi:hypothetical protein
MVIPDALARLFAPIINNWSAVATALAVSAGLYLLVVLYRQFVSDEDPSMRYTVENAAGTTVMLMSGTHVAVALAATIAAVTWPLAVESPLGVILALALVGSYIAEKREVAFS